MMIVRSIAWILLSILLISCVFFPDRKFDVQYIERADLAFTGKGAAAGIMLDSVLGGTGIAIGIAIDEGIAKDIAKEIHKANPEYNFLDVVRRELSISLKSNSFRRYSPVQVAVERYGFRGTSGAHTQSFKDAVSPWVTLEFDCAGVVKVISYPERVHNPVAAELQDIKTDGKIAINQLSIAVHQLVEQWKIDGACNSHS